MLGRAAAVLADEADRMAVIDHHHGVVLFREIADAPEIGDDAVHGKHAVGGDQPEAAVFRLLQSCFEIGHVVVGVAVALGFAEPDAVDDAGMVERVADHRVFLAEQRLEQPAIGVEAGGIEDRIAPAEEAGDARLQRLVQILGPADEAHRGEAEAVILQRLMGGGDDGGMVGQAQIIIGAEVQHLAPGLDPDVRALRAGDDPLLLEQGIPADALDLAGQPRLQRGTGFARPYCHEQTTLPHCPLAIRSKPVWNSSIGM